MSEEWKFRCKYKLNGGSLTTQKSWINGTMALVEKSKDVWDIELRQTADQNKIYKCYRVSCIQ